MSLVFIDSCQQVLSPHIVFLEISLPPLPGELVSHDWKLQGLRSVQENLPVSGSRLAPRKVIPGPGVSEARNRLVASSGTEARSPGLPSGASV